MTEKYFVKWAAPAREDLNEIVEYIDQINSSYAVKILDKIESAVKTLDTSPKRGRVVPELEKYGYLLYREIIVDYWRILYKVENELVYVMVVIDGRRNIEDVILRKLLMREGEVPKSITDSLAGFIPDDGRDYKELLDEARMERFKQKGFDIP
jgi:addiction module RelE/StbE family toxin